MTLNVLQNKVQISEARELLVGRGVSSIDSLPVRVARHTGLLKGVAIGDQVKSWDVELTVSFLQAHVTKDAAIADFGCFASEILVSLDKAGYSNLTGVDLNPQVARMPHADRINYVVSDFMNSPLHTRSLSAVTSISVIEHGYDPERLLSEVARLLKVGGYFIASFDYWPEKIPTDDTQFFGMSWLIFAKSDVQQLIAMAAAHGLVPVGDLHFESDERAISCAGRDYTFAHLVLQRRS